MDLGILPLKDRLCRSLHIEVGPTVSEASDISRLPEPWNSPPSEPAAPKPGQVPRN